MLDVNSLYTDTSPLPSSAESNRRQMFRSLTRNTIWKGLHSGHQVTVWLIGLFPCSYLCLTQKYSLSLSPPLSLSLSPPPSLSLSLSLSLSVLVSQGRWTFLGGKLQQKVPDEPALLSTGVNKNIVLFNMCIIFIYSLIIIYLLLLDRETEM